MKKKGIIWIFAILCIFVQTAYAQTSGIEEFLYGSWLSIVVAILVSASAAFAIFRSLKLREFNIKYNLVGIIAEALERVSSAFDKWKQEKMEKKLHRLKQTKVQLLEVYEQEKKNSRDLERQGLQELESARKTAADRESQILREKKGEEAKKRKREEEKLGKKRVLEVEAIRNNLFSALHGLGLYKTPEERRRIQLQKERERREKLKRIGEQEKQREAEEFKLKLQRKRELKRQQREEKQFKLEKEEQERKAILEEKKREAEKKRQEELARKDKEARQKALQRKSELKKEQQTKDVKKPNLLKNLGAIFSKSEKPEPEAQKEAIDNKAAFEKVKQQFKRLPKETKERYKLEVAIARQLEFLNDQFCVADVMKKIDILYGDQLSSKDRVDIYDDIKNLVNGEYCQKVGEKNKVPYYKFV